MEVVNGAVSGIKKLKITSDKQISIGNSNVSSMISGQKVGNQMLTDLSRLVDCVMNQSDAIVQLAQTIEMRDSQTKFGK